MTRNIKISSIGILIILLSVIIYLSVDLAEAAESKVVLIEVNGNMHLPKDKYLKFAELSERNNEADSDISIIRDRLMKHPYIERVDVIIDKSVLKIEISEKRVEAILLYDNNEYLITDNSVAIPMLPYTEKINYPVITNPLVSSEVEPVKKVLDQKDVVCALKILTSLKLVNPDLFEQLSEINLRSGRDILMMFSNFEYPVIIGRGSEIKKVVTFNTLWNYLNGKNINNMINYVDLRYSGHIFLGFAESENSEKENVI